MRSYHDDLIMSLAIGCWVRDTALQVDKKDVEYKKAMLDGIIMNSTKMNTAIKGMEGYNKEFQEKYKDEIEQTKEFVWIFKG